MHERAHIPEKLGTQSYSWEFPSDTTTEQLDSIEATIEEKALAFGWPEDELQPLIIGFREIFLNALIHGNLKLQKTEENKDYFFQVIQYAQSKDQSGKKVRVKISVSEGRLEFVVQDEGTTGITVEKVPRLTDQENGKKTSGRGVLMTQNFFDEFDLHPIKNGDKIVGTEAVMVKFRNK